MDPHTPGNAPEPDGGRTERVGLVGLGTMGKRFASDLLDADYPLRVYDIDDDQLAWATERGAGAAASAAEVARGSDVVLLSLPSAAALEAAMEGDDGVLEGLSPGTTVVDTGTFRPAVCERYARLCEREGAGYLEAPVTRAHGTMLMVGGPPESYGALSGVFSAIASHHRRVGPVGSGQVLKLMKQIVQAGYDAACAEAVEFGRDSGVDPELLNDYLRMDVSERLFGEEFRIPDEGGAGHMGLRAKDLAAAVAHANETGTALPLTDIVSEAHKTAVRTGPDEPRYHEGIVAYWRLLDGR